MHVFVVTSTSHVAVFADSYAIFRAYAEFLHDDPSGWDAMRERIETARQNPGHLIDFGDADTISYVEINT